MSEPGCDADSVEACAFCGKARREVHVIVAGPAMGICDECVSVAYSMVTATPRPVQDPPPVSYDVAVEREACARLAENEPSVGDADATDPQHRIAAKIRARGELVTARVAPLTDAERADGWSGLWAVVVDTDDGREAVRVRVRQVPNPFRPGRTEWCASADHAAAAGREPARARYLAHAVLAEVEGVGAASAWQLVSMVMAEGAAG